MNLKFSHITRCLIAAAIALLAWSATPALGQNVQSSTPLSYQQFQNSFPLFVLQPGPVQTGHDQDWLSKTPVSNTFGTGDGTSKTFATTLTGPVEQGSFTVTAGTVIGKADSNGVIFGPGVNGTLNYETGSISVTFGQAPAVSVSVIAAYHQVVSWVDSSGAIHGVISGGAVTSFSAGNLSPLFTTSVATPTSTPALSFTLSNAGAFTLFSNNSSGAAHPSFTTMDSIFGSCSASTSALTYDTSTHAFGCNTTSSGSVTSVSGTANQITSTGGTTPMIAVANPLIIPGQTTIIAPSGNFPGVIVGCSSNAGNPHCADFPLPGGGPGAWIDYLGGGNFTTVNTGAVGTPGAAIFSDAQTPTPNTITLSAPATITASYRAILPATQSIGPLANDGSGNLSWGGTGAFPTINQVGGATADATIPMMGHTLSFNWNQPFGQVGSQLTINPAIVFNPTFGDACGLGEAVCIKATGPTSPVSALIVELEQSTTGNGFAISGTNSSSSTTPAVGIIGSATDEGTASPTGLYGVDGYIEQDSSGTVSSAFAFHAEPIYVNSGIVTIGGGLLIDDQTSAATNYAIKTGLGLNYFGGLVQIPFGIDAQTTGWYGAEVANNASMGTAVNKLVCDDGAGKGIICPHATSTTNTPIGIAVGGAGTTGNVITSDLGFISVIFDNQTTALHWAIESTSADGELTDTGSVSQTGGQPNFFIWTANAGAGTAAIVRILTADEFTSASGGGGGPNKIQVNGNGAQPTVNFNGTTPAAGAGNLNTTWQSSKSGNTTSASNEVPYASPLSVSGGNLTCPNCVTNGTGGHDIYQHFEIPFAACPNAAASAGVSYGSALWTAACYAGSNNLGGALQGVPSAGTAILQFLFKLPSDWDTTTQPKITIAYGSATNTTGTVIWTAASACTKSDGSVTSDPAFNAESAFTTQTMANASRMWAVTGQFTAMTSGNNCIAGSPVIIKLTLSGTAGSAINAFMATLSVPRTNTF